jgi:DHA1 family tetracycline resistance protein-like MFS transporter
MTATTPRKPATIFIFFTLVIAMMGIGLIVPVLPGLITQFKGGDVAEGSHVYGWMVGVYALMQFIGSPCLGALSDRFGRRRVILIALAGSTIDYVIMALAPTLAWMFVARMIAGLTAGVLATANAYIADVTPPDKRAQAFGMIGAAIGLGFILGPALGGMLGNIGLRVPFWVAAGLAAANWLYGLFILPESLAPENRRPFDLRRANPVGALLALRRFPVVRGLTEPYFILAIAQTMLQSVWVLYMGYRYGWTSFQVGLSLALLGLTSVLVQAGLVKHIIARVGETRGVIMGFAITIVAQLCYGFATQGWMIYVIIVASSIAGVGGPALQSYITRQVPADEQGAVQGALGGLTSVAGIIGPPLAAWSFSWGVDPGSRFHVPGIPFFESAALIALALFLAMRSFRQAGARPNAV